MGRFQKGTRIAISATKRQLGFGESLSSVTDKDLKRAVLFYKMARVFLIVALVLFILFLGSYGVVYYLLTGAFLIFMASAIYLKWVKGCYFGSMNHLVAHLRPTVRLGDVGVCDALTCDDSVEAYMWKKELMMAAEESIVLSGGYSGGETFDEILELLKGQLRNKDRLRIVIISSFLFITGENRLKIQECIELYPQRFQWIECPDILYLNRTLKKTTNHMKTLVIDCGKYFMQGGTGIEERYVMHTGLEKVGKGKSVRPWNILDKVLPAAFRDQDFVFYSPQIKGIGKLVYQESLKLLHRWEGLIQESRVDLKENLRDLGVRGQSVIETLLYEEIEGSPYRVPTCSVTKFHLSSKLVKNCLVKILCSGPEHRENVYKNELIEQFKSAKKRILINQLYFQPSKPLMEALIEAANRGVQITVITTGHFKDICPSSHQLFGPHNRRQIIRLYRQIDPAFRKNFEAYEYKVSNTSLHKKIIVVDDYVIAGSSNLSYKSLVSMSDHEMNFVLQSEAFADYNVRIALEQDKVKSLQVTDFRLKMSDRIKAGFNHFLGPLLG